MHELERCSQTFASGSQDLAACSNSSFSHDVFEEFNENGECYLARQCQMLNFGCRHVEDLCQD